MKPLRRGRLTYEEKRQQITKRNLWDQFCAAAAEVAPKFQQDVPPPKAHRIRRTVDDKPALPLEKHVLAAVLDALRCDPRVALVWRMQSGVFQDGDRFIRVGSRGLPDIVFLLVGGRMGACEVKRPGKRPDERQLEVLETLRRNGACAGWATSVEEALALLP